MLLSSCRFLFVWNAAAGMLSCRFFFEDLDGQMGPGWAGAADTTTTFLPSSSLRGPCWLASFLLETRKEHQQTAWAASLASYVSYSFSTIFHRAVGRASLAAPGPSVQLDSSNSEMARGLDVKWIVGYGPSIIVSRECRVHSNLLSIGRKTMKHSMRERG